MLFTKSSKLQNVISDHPIFSEISSTQVLSDESLKFSSIVSLIDQKKHLKVAGYGETDSNIRDVIAVRGTEIFLAAEGQIRCADCGKVQEAGNQLRYYKTLNITGLDFSVRRLQINNSGTYLAIVGDRKVIVCALPLPGFSKRSETKIHVRHRSLGTETVDADVSILKTLWHPLAKDDSCLVVLSSDRVVRMFDFVYNYEEPEQVFDFSHNLAQDFSFGLSDSVGMEPVSMCFGVKDQGLGEMALYVLMEDGDICVLCPFIPRQCAMERQSIQIMLEWALSEDRDVDSDITKIERFRRRQQLNWIADVAVQSNDISKSVGMAPRMNELGEVIDLGVFDRPDTDKFRVRLQGPVSIRPYPKLLYKAGRACDIISLEVDDIALLVTVSTAGRVNINIQESPIGALWISSLYAALVGQDDEDAEVDELSLLLFESIALDYDFTRDNEDNQFPLWFVSGTARKSYLLVVYAHRLVQLDFSKWKRRLVDALSDGKDLSLRQLLANPPRTHINSLYKSSLMSENRILGTGILQDIFSGDILIAMTSSGIYVYEHDTQEDTIISSKSDENSSLSIVSSTEKLSIGATYEPLMNPLSVDIERLRRGSTIESKLSRKKALLNFSLTERLKVSEDTLQFLGDTVELLEPELKEVYLAGQTIQRRLVEQRAEVHRQLGKLAEIQSRLVSSQHEEISSNVQRVIARQKELNERADKLYRNLIESQALPISESERKWIQELHRVRTTLEDPRALVYRCRNATTQSQKLISVMDSVRDHETGLGAKRKILVTGLHREKVDYLTELLENEARIVNKTKASLESIITRVDTEFARLRLDEN
ncbi:hypothetical protein POJ06DRAFT_260304 [Lipomyces tetrasporus]|uniref:Nucleoporin Nup82 n=1 Tax=Lipomyces tetrasporus TaxID=54092 RepID=A0AAD7QM58_9ASCO|nr:uncharacterized protein POJ06DRAFT_260304 [Lipomyces tetrasporus]KAJ8097857.1 hypothetical protein POJ06DRAFT_260304 [Lipomyces tetrasporus]